MPDAKPSLAKLALSLVSVLGFPTLLLVLGGDWRWTEGWLFFAWFAALCITVNIYLYVRDPALLAERFKTPGSANQKGWDAYVVVALSIGFIGWIVVMPLDAERYAWSGEFPLWLKASGCGALLGSSFFFFRSFVDNTFLSPLVRIQGEREQRVISTGVYGLVRHPMYLGAILMFIGTPELLGSLCGIGGGLALALLLVGRIAGEEKVLTDELEGYADYKTRVRFRLIPFVW